MEDHEQQQSHREPPARSAAERSERSSGNMPAETVGPEGLDDHQSRALFVTRPTHFSMDEERSKEERNVEGSKAGRWQVLSHGIDSLDLGLFVTWNRFWGKLTKELEARKRRAQGRDTVLWKEQNCLVNAGGKKPNYRWHLAYPSFHLFLAKNGAPVAGTPNVYVSLNSEVLWKRGLTAATSQVREIIERLGGRVDRIQVSRCDPCVDFLADQRLTSEFLERHRVPQHRFQDMKKSGDDLETYYNGAKGSPIQVRIYDKAREVLKTGYKLWF